MAIQPPPRELTAAYTRLGSIAGVAQEFDIAFETARRWLIAAGTELNPPHRPSPGAARLRLNDIVKRYQAGESAAAIASTLEVSPNTVRNRLLDAGVPLRPRPGWRY